MQQTSIAGAASARWNRHRLPAGVGHRSDERAVINVAIIEDNRLVREGMTSLLDELPDVHVVLAAPSAETEQLLEAKPRVVLIDAGLQEGSSLHLAATVKRHVANAEVVVMDLLAMHEEVAQFVHVGVAGFILKDATFEEMVGTIRSVAAGGRVLPPRMAGTLFSQVAEAAVGRGRAAALASVHLTDRERGVIALLAGGMNNKEIAERLDIAVYTVKSHVRNIMDKLALHTRLQIAAYAHEHDE